MVSVISVKRVILILCSNYQAFGINIDGGFADMSGSQKEAVRQGNVICIDEKTTMRAALS